VAEYVELEKREVRARAERKKVESAEAAK